MVLLSEKAQRAVVARGWPPGRSTLIRNGIAIPSGLRQGWLRPALGLPIDAIILICVGSLIARKGYDILLPAVVPYLSGNPERHLLIVGDGPDKSEVIALANSFGVSQRVHLLGLRNDVPDLLADSDLFVLASRAEGLTLAVVEAMAAQLPVVVTDVGGHREVVTSATGWIVPSDDVKAFQSALTEALSELPSTRARGVAGRQLVSTHFSLEAQVDSQYRYFESTWKSSRRGREVVESE